MMKNRLLATSIVAFGMLYSAEGMQNNGLPKLNLTLTPMSTNSVNQFAAVTQFTSTQGAVNLHDIQTISDAEQKAFVFTNLKDLSDELIGTEDDGEFEKIAEINLDFVLEHITFDDHKNITGITSELVDFLLKIVSAGSLCEKYYYGIMIPAVKSLSTLWNSDNNQKMNVVKLLRIIYKINDTSDNKYKIDIDEFKNAIKENAAKYFLYTKQEYAFKIGEITTANNAERQRLQDSIDVKILLLRTFKDYYKGNATSEIEEIIDNQVKQLNDLVGNKTEDDLEAAKQSSIYGNVKMFLGLFPDNVTSSLAKKGFTTEERTLLDLITLDNYCVFLASRYFDKFADHANLAQVSRRFRGNMGKFYYNPVCKDGIYQSRSKNILKPQNVKWDETSDGMYTFFNVCRKYLPNVRQFYISKDIMASCLYSENTFKTFRDHIKDYVTTYNEEQKKKSNLTPYTKENGLQIFCSFPLAIHNVDNDYYLNRLVTLYSIVNAIDKDMNRTHYKKEIDIAAMKPFTGVVNLNRKISTKTDSILETNPRTGVVNLNRKISTKTDSILETNPRTEVVNLDREISPKTEPNPITGVQNDSIPIHLICTNIVMNCLDCKYRNMFMAGLGLKYEAESHFEVPYYVYAIADYESGDTEGLRRYVQSISGPSVRELFPNALIFSKNLKTVNFPGIEKIGDFAFEGCKQLEKISFGGTIKRYNANGELQEIKSNGNQILSVGYGIFKDCNNLDFDTAYTILFGDKSKEVVLGICGFKLGKDGITDKDFSDDDFMNLMIAFLFDRAPANAVIKIPEGVVKLPAINRFGSESWKSVKKFKLSATVDSIHKWFFTDSGIKELTLPIKIKFDENSIRDCRNIKTVTFINETGEVFTTESVSDGIERETYLIDIINTIKTKTQH